VPLPLVAHLRRAPEGKGVARHPGPRERCNALFLHLADEGVRLRPVEAVERGEIGADEIEGQRRDEEAERGGHARAERHDQFRCAEDARDAVGVDRPRAAEGEDRVGARVFATLHGMDARRARHILVHHLMDSPRRLDDAHPERFRDPPHRRRRRFRIERHPPTEEKARIEIAKQHIGVRHRRRDPAAPVTCRTRFRARRIWPDLEQPERGHPRDRAAARADLDHLDDRHAHRQAAAALKPVHARHLKIGGDERLAAVDEARFRRRAAHVEREEIWAGSERAVIRGGERARRRAGLDQADRETARRLDRRRTAAAEHDEKRRGSRAEFAQPRLQLPQIPLDERAHVDIRQRRRGALILANLRHHVGRERNEQFRRLLRQRRAEQLLVCRIAVRMEERDGDGLRATGTDRAHERRDLRRVERGVDLPGRQHALVDLEAAAARRERFGHLDEEIVEVVAPFATDFDGVAEAARGEQGGHGALPLDERIRDEGRAVNDATDRLRPHAGDRQRLPKPRDDALRRFPRRRERLADAQRAGARVEGDQVREGSADVHPDTQ